MDSNQFFEKAGKSEKWYYKAVFVIIGLILLGPFAFPVLWKSPNFNLFWKVVLTLIFTFLTYYMFVKTMDVVQMVIDEFKKAGLL